MALVMTQGVTDYTPDVNGNHLLDDERVDQFKTTGGAGEDLTQGIDIDKVGNNDIPPEISEDAKIAENASQSNLTEKCIQGSDLNPGEKDSLPMENTSGMESTMASCDHGDLQPLSTGEHASSQVSGEGGKKDSQLSAISDAEVGQMSDTASSGPYEWHHFCGRVIKRRESVEFYRQVDHVDIWVDQWNHQQKCAVVDKILTRSNLTQFKFLWTTLQPTLHRDFMYAAQLQFPGHRFMPISSHVSRETKARRAVRNYHHISSAYLKSRLDVLECNRELKPVKSQLPVVTKSRSKADKSILSQSLPASLPFGQVTCRSAPEASRRHNRPIRRHMDDYLCRDHQMSASGDASYGYHPVDEDDLPKLIKSSSDIQLNIVRPTLSGTSVRNLPPISPLPGNAWQLLHWYSNCWNDVERNEFLHKLLKKFDARQLYYVACILAMKQSRDYLSLLPEHLALRILSFLSPVDLLTCAQVSRSWNILSSHNKIWKVKCQLVKIDIPIPSSPVSWKKIYRDNVFLKSNWKEGTCKVMDLRGHTAKVHCVAFDGHNRLASGSKDNTVRLWDIKTGQLIHTFRGHTKGIWSVKFFTNHLLVSGSYDNTIKVWNSRSGTCTRTLLGHEGCIWDLALKKHFLASASQDRSVKVWDMNNCSLLHTLTGHAQAVFCVDMDKEGTMVISGSADRSVRIWNLHSGQQMKVLWVSQSTSVMAVSYDRGYFVCSVGENVSLWRVETGACIRKYHEHEKRVETVGLRVDSIKNPDKPRGLLVTAGEEGLVKYWNLHSKHSHQTLRASHGSQVNSIYFDETKIVSACADYRIRIWNFHTS